MSSVLSLAVAGQAGRGTDFFLAFPQHRVVQPSSDHKLKLSVVVFNPTEYSVNVDFFFPKMTSLAINPRTLTAGQFTRLELDDSLQLQV